MSEDPAFEIPVGFADDVSFAVPIAHFNHGELDSPEDHIREAVAQRKPVMPLVAKLCKVLIEREQVVAIKKVLGMVSKAKKPRKRVSELMFACGMYENDPRVTIYSLARDYGVSPQDIENGVNEVCDELGLRKTRTMRSEEAKKEMSKRNYRPTQKHK